MIFEYVSNFLFSIYCYLACSWIHPNITKIQKITIMGKVIDKTVDFHNNVSFINPLDTWVVFSYRFNGSSYKLGTSPRFYKEALKYIENLSSDNQPFLHWISKAFYIDSTNSNSCLIEDPVVDITQIIKEYAGPYNDFYANHPFSTTKKLLIVFEFLNILDLNSNIYLLEYTKTKEIKLHSNYQFANNEID